MFWFFIPAALTLIGWLFSVWENLSNETKFEIIEIVVSTFVKLFKKYYQDKTKPV